MIVLIQLSDKYKLVLYCIKILIHVIAVLQTNICWLYGRDENIDGHCHCVDPVAMETVKLFSILHSPVCKNCSEL